MKFAKIVQLIALVATTVAAKRSDSVPDKGGMLRAFNQVAAKHAFVHCDEETEETCYNDDWSCAAIADGGCPCPEGEVKCGADDEIGYDGDRCAAVCCDEETEETCYDDYGLEPLSCAAIAEGCHCTKKGEKRCWGDENWAGVCTDYVCCDWPTEETCYDDNYKATCAAVVEGGCPCRKEGQVKCGADEETGYAGWCYSGKCPSNTSHDMEKDRIAMFIQAKGTPKEISYFHYLEMKQKTLLAHGETPVNSAEKLGLEQKEIKLFHAIKLREENHSAKNEVSFMLKKSD